VKSPAFKAVVAKEAETAVKACEDVAGTFNAWEAVVAKEELIANVALSAIEALVARSAKDAVAPGFRYEAVSANEDEVSYEISCEAEIAYDAVSACEAEFISPSNEPLNDPLEMEDFK